MTAIIVSTLIASFIGSCHCIGMCGPFAMIASSPTMRNEKGTERTGKSWSLIAGYNLGRLVVYLAFGILAGALGLTAEFSGRSFGLQQAAIYLSGGTLVVGGLIGIARNLGVRTFTGGSSQWLTRILREGIRNSKGHSPLIRAALMGMLTSLMPCGWLYFFVIAASSTQSLLLAPMVMFFFWLGTLPALVSMVVSTRFLLGTALTRFHWIVPVMMVCVGIYSLANRSPVELGDPMHSADTHQLNQAISNADSSLAPCCCHDNS